jgi:protein-L-isoaspartate O-methyltransferase
VADFLTLLAREVVSVERFGGLAAQARANLAAVGLGHAYGAQRRPGRDGR